MFVRPDQLFFWTKKPPEFGSENWKIQILENFRILSRQGEN